MKYVRVGCPSIAAIEIEALTSRRIHREDQNNHRIFLPTQVH